MSFEIAVGDGGSLGTVLLDGFAWKVIAVLPATTTEPERLVVRRWNSHHTRTIASAGARIPSASELLSHCPDCGGTLNGSCLCAPPLLDGHNPAFPLIASGVVMPSGIGSLFGGALGAPGAASFDNSTQYTELIVAASGALERCKRRAPLGETKCGAHRETKPAPKPSKAPEPALRRKERKLRLGD